MTLYSFERNILIKKKKENYEPTDTVIITHLLKEKFYVSQLCLYFKVSFITHRIPLTKTNGCLISSCHRS